MKTRLASLALLALVLAVAAPARAGLVYNVVEYSDSDFSISGTITTDGTFADFTATPFNFQSWSITFVDPSSGLTLVFNDSNSIWSANDLDPAGPLSVTPADILLNRPITEPRDGQTITLLGTSGLVDKYLIDWATSRTQPLVTITLTKSDDFFVFNQYSGSSETGLLVATAVPEPSSLALAGTGVAFAGLALYRRRRRATA